VHRNAHEIHTKEAAIESAVWISAGLLFGLVVLWEFGSQAAGEYMGGYLIEKSLSVDNVFVWAVLFTHFQVPKIYQHRVLFWGIFGALGLVALAAILLLSMRWHSDPACRGAGAALAGAFVHNLVDFHDEMPGVAVSLAVCAALFTARPGRPKSHAGVSVRVRAGMVAAATLAGILGTYALMFSHHELGAEQRSFQTWSLDRQLPKA
jgi:predicted tellurium resistance membrane protein TerC